MLLWVPEEDRLSQFEVFLRGLLEKLDLETFLIASDGAESEGAHEKSGHFEQMFLSSTYGRLVVLGPPEEGLAKIDIPDSGSTDEMTDGLEGRFYLSWLAAHLVLVQSALSLEVAGQVVGCSPRHLLLVDLADQALIEEGDEEHCLMRSN